MLPLSHPLADADLAGDNILRGHAPSGINLPGTINQRHPCFDKPRFYGHPRGNIQFLYGGDTPGRRNNDKHPFLPSPYFWLLAFLSLTNSALVTVFTLPGFLIGLRAVDPRRPHDPPSRLTLCRASHQPATILSPLSLFTPRRSKLSPSATKHQCPGPSLLARVYYSLCSFRVTPQVQKPTECNSYTTASHSDTALPVLTTAPSPWIACPTQTLVNKGLR